jgi:hypothetical protein
MNTGEQLYEISRYDPSADTEVLVERAQLIKKGGELWRRSRDGSGIRCSSVDVAAEIEADPTLSDVRANEVTRITAGKDALRLLPLLLRVPGDSSDFEEARWSQVMRETHLEEALGVERGAYRVVYVNGDRWGAFDTTDGVRLLPDDSGHWAGYNGELPSLDGWGQLTFGESASRTYGLDIATIGLATPGLVVCTALPDEQDADIRLEPRGDDAETFLNWLLHGSLTDNYFSCEFGEALLAQLFVEVMDGGEYGVISGDFLVAGLDGDLSDLGMMGIYSSSEWTLDVILDKTMADAVLDRLDARGGRLRDVVTAARDPESPAGKARRAAVEQLEQLWEQEGGD